MAFYVTKITTIKSRQETKSSLPSQTDWECGRVSSITLPGGEKTEYWYNYMGLVEKVTDDLKISYKKFVSAFYNSNLPSSSLMFCTDCWLAWAFSFTISIDCEKSFKIPRERFIEPSSLSERSTTFFMPSVISSV